MQENRLKCIKQHIHNKEFPDPKMSTVLKLKTLDCTALYIKSLDPHFYSPFNSVPCGLLYHGFTKKPRQLYTFTIFLNLFNQCKFSSVQFSHSAMSVFLWPHGLQHARLPCPSPTSRTCSNSCPKVGDAIQPSHPLSSPSPPAFNLSQHQGLFQWVSSSYQVVKVLKLQLQHQSFQWIFRTDFL